MKPRLTTAICVALALTAAPLSAAAKTFNKVEVKTDLSAYDDSNALEFWPTLDADLAKAIAVHADIESGDNAPVVRVEIGKVAINGETLLPANGEFNQLEGTVTVYRGYEEDTSGADKNVSPGEVLQSFPLKVTAVAGDALVPEGWIALPPAREDFYRALVDAYAAETVRRVKP